VVACRGSTPPDELLDTLEGLNLNRPILMRVPCVGRLPSVFYITAISMGIKQIVIIQCKQDFCRFEKGSLMNYRRVVMLQSLLKAFGYANNTITVIERAKQIEYDTAKCVGCDKCINICPYGRNRSTATVYTEGRLYKMYGLWCVCCCLPACGTRDTRP